MTTKSTKTKRTKTKTAAKPRPTAEVNTRAEGVGPYAPTIPAEFTIGRMLGGPPEPRVACVAAAVVALDAQTSNSGLVGSAAHCIRSGRSAFDGAPPKVDALLDALALAAANERRAARRILAEAVSWAGDVSREAAARHNLDNAASLFTSAARADELALWLARVKVFDAVSGAEDEKGTDDATARTLACNAAGFRLPE